jgi:succinate dehydrogenase/fumarate reductase flavoprotein subunit
MISNVRIEEYRTDVLIIGGGIAATFAAVRARREGADVILVDKGYAGCSGLSPWFTGFAYYDPDASNRAEPEEWHHGFMWATESMSRKDYIDLFLEESKTCWDELRSWVPDAPLKTGKGPYLRKQIEKSGTKIFDGIMIAELLKVDGRVVGALGIAREDDRALIFRAGAVIICTGSGTFKIPGWPMSPNTFDGQAMAYKLGAEIAGKEWNDFHWSDVNCPGDAWHSFGYHLSTPLGGETDPGAHSLREIFWSAFEHAPMDVFPPPPQGKHANAPENEIRVLGGTLGCAEHRMDGIFPSDSSCGTGIDGLYAAGDAICTGGVGTKGSAAPGCAVQGATAGIYAAEYALMNNKVDLDPGELLAVQKRIFEPRTRQKGYSPEWVTRTLQNIMQPYYVLYVKHEERLLSALSNVMHLQEHFVPRLTAKDPHEHRLALEAENLVLNAEMKLRASLFRKESRHSHFREDYPFRDDENWLSFVLLRKGCESMDVSKWDIPQEWIPASIKALPYQERYVDRFPGELDYFKQKGISLERKKEKGD